MKNMTVFSGPKPEGIPTLRMQFSVNGVPKKPSVQNWIDLPICDLKSSVKARLVAVDAKSKMITTEGEWSAEMAT